MEVTHLLDSLNPVQREVVSAPISNLMVIAGAGSGKTRVLVHRIVWLMQVQGLSSQEILAVTFTNKAAREMRSRIEEMLGYDIRSMWAGTFHGLAHRMLRLHWEDAGLPENFQILDADDQLRLIKRIHKALDLDESRWPPKHSQWFINKKKEDGERPKDVVINDHSVDETFLRVYQAYEELCERSGLVDFSELLLRNFELLRDTPEILSHYQRRFRYILVDEFQDTNNLQYQWLKLLSGDNNNAMVVGDDDQSIYSWRGANVENIRQFTRDFANATTIRLEQNYRSTKTILNAANAVIANNSQRMGKELWTDGEQGEPISLYAAFNELDEARFIIDRIKQWISEGHSAEEVAILYRSNAQSRVLEEALLSANIPYRIYGGHKFFERAEIKDALGYLRLVANRHDDAAFERAVNTPPRGIGNATINTLREQSKENNISLWQAANFVVKHQLLPNRALNAIKIFINLINEMDNNILQLSLDEQTQYILKVSGLFDHVSKEKSENARSRLENLEELVNACHSFNPKEHQLEGMSPLQAFLTHVALETHDMNENDQRACVQMMTLHSAKGLEFELVFIGGVEEGLFPHHMSLESPNGLEEERRLCYVGITRAKKKLYICYAETRSMHGKQHFHKASRFIHEIPKQYLDEVRIRTTISRPISIDHSLKPASNHIIGDSGFQLGQRVTHKKFGDGIVLNYEGQGDNLRLQINFPNYGVKWLVANYANLQ